MLDLRGVCFLAAALVYGITGSPTPDSFGWSEAVTGIFLILAIGPVSACYAVVGRQKYGWALAAQCLLFYGLVVPVVVGLGSGNAPANMMRDMIPFLFLLLPFFMQDWREKPQETRNMLLVGVVLIGVGFGARVFFPVLLTVWQGGLWQKGAGDDALYLSIAPSVVFTAILLTASAGVLLYQRITSRHLLWAVILGAGAFLAFAALLITLQRASLGLAAFALVVLLVLGMIHRPVKMLVPLGVGLVLLFLLSPVLNEALASLIHKQALVGTNMRVQEAAKVLDDLGGSVWTVFFGKGWGATLASPAVGGNVVNFTHNLLTSYWLKTGLFGVILLLAYLCSLGWGLVGILRDHPVLGLALAVPLGIDVMLYASFKSLDFGLILVVLMVFAPYGAWLRHRAS